MKDALGHGSNERGGPIATHAAAINSLPAKDWLTGVSDATYRASMPLASFRGCVQDLLGLWSGSQKPEPLSKSEQDQVGAAYAKRGDWREVARNIQDQRRSNNFKAPGTSKLWAQRQGRRA